MSLEFKDDLVRRPLWQRIKGRFATGPNGKLMIEDCPPRRRREFRGVIIGVAGGIIIFLLLLWSIS